MLNFRTKELEAIATRLGLTSEALAYCLQVSCAEEAQKRLDALKLKVKKAYKEAALELHPDRNSGDDEKAEEFKELSVAYTYIEKCMNSLRIGHVQPQPTYRVVRINITHTNNTGTATTFSSNWWDRTTG